MAEMEKSIVVEAPLREVYNQWTQFEDFPKFMDGVLEVRQLDDKHLYWKAKVAGNEREWQSEIVDQTPDTRIAWKSVTGAENAGAVLFKAVAEGTEVTLKLVYDPEGAAENIADALGFVSRKVKGDLDRFKRLMDDRRVATGGWRGEIHGQEVTKP